jgi:hypothetical protein
MAGGRSYKHKEETSRSSFVVMEQFYTLLVVVVSQNFM